MVLCMTSRDADYKCLYTLSVCNFEVHADEVVGKK